MTRKIFNVGLAFLFLAVIFLPLLSKVAPLAPRVGLRERRKLADRPKLQWTLPGLMRYPGEFDRYYRDNFGFRSSLVYLFSRIRSRMPGLVVGNNVLVGRDGWYFITMNRTIDDFLGLIRLPPSDLEKIKEVVEERKEWLALFGIKYLLAIAPAKWEIYPEKIPFKHNRVKDRTVLDQIAAYLKDNSGIDWLDLRGPLREMKNAYDVYFRADTHWNRIGVFVAVQEIKKRLSEWYPSLSADNFDNYHIIEESEYSGDLARMMGLAAEISDKKYMLIARDGEVSAPGVSARENSSSRTVTFETPPTGPHKPRAVIFHDSFGKFFPSYLSDSFRRSVYRWGSFLDARLIIQEHPDVVIQELAERDVLRTLSHNLPGIAGPASVLAGKAASFICPGTYKLTDFKAKALSGLPVRQYIALSCNGKTVFEWPLEEEEKRFVVPPLPTPPDRGILAYAFAYRHDPPLASHASGRHTLPFELRVKCGGDNSFIGINGGEFVWLEGYNIFSIDPDGRVFQAQNFDYVRPGTQGPAMARFIKQMKGKKGFLLLVDQRDSGPGLSQPIQAALHSIGLRGYARDRRPWNHIALVDLGLKKVIAERAGPEPQRFLVGNYRTDAGFRVRSLQVKKDRGEVEMMDYLESTAFITDYPVVDRVIDYLKLTFVADRPPRPRSPIRKF